MISQFCKTLLCFAVLLQTACPPAATTKKVAKPELAAAGPQVRSFSETRPVTAIAETSKKVYVGDAEGLRSYDQQTGLGKLVLGPDGKSLGAIRALAVGEALTLWVATDTGLHSRRNGAWVTDGNAPPGISVLLWTRGGLLAGGAKGLALRAKGVWQRLLPGAAVTVAVDNRAGKGVWIGTAREGLYQLVGGKLRPHALDRGQPLRRVDAITYTSDGGVLALGADQSKRPLLSFFDGKHWSLYWPPPRADLRYVAQVGGHILLAGAAGTYSLQRARRVEGQPLPTSYLDLSAERSRVAPRDYPVPYFFVRPLDHWVPADAAVVVDGGDHLLFGTERLGVARYDGKRLRWVRGQSLTRGARRLRAGCAQGHTCYVAFGGQGYRFDGRAFHRASPTTDTAARVQAYIDDGRGRVWALHTPSNQLGSLVVSELSAAGTFTPRATVEVKVPHGMPLVRFITWGPQGKLWLGLRYRDKQGELRPWGLSVIGLDGSSLYHRSSTLPTEDRPAGSLALPDDVRDIYFKDGELWLATDMGICHVVGQKVTQITENEGLASELAYMMGLSPSGQLIVATYAGLGRFDGKYWRFDAPPPLRSRIGGFLVEGDTLWVASAKGLVRYRPGAKGKGELLVIGERQGLADDGTRDVFRAPDDTLWVLTDRGISIVDGLPRPANANKPPPKVVLPSPTAQPMATPAPHQLTPVAPKHTPERLSPARLNRRLAPTPKKVAKPKKVVKPKRVAKPKKVAKPKPKKVVTPPSAAPTP